MESLPHTHARYPILWPECLIKVEASKLKPYTTYYYQFNVCNSDLKSPLGRTKTTPAPEDKLAKVGLAVYSCSNYPFGFFNAYVRESSIFLVACFLIYCRETLCVKTRSTMCFIWEITSTNIRTGSMAGEIAWVISVLYFYKATIRSCVFSIGRIPQPDRQIFTLYDYRRRLAQYRTDLDLLLSHNQFAWIAVWVI